MCSLKWETAYSAMKDVSGGEKSVLVGRRLDYITDAVKQREPLTLIDGVLYMFYTIMPGAKYGVHQAGPLGTRNNMWGIVMDDSLAALVCGKHLQVGAEQRKISCNSLGNLMPVEYLVQKCNVCIFLKGELWNLCS